MAWMPSPGISARLKVGLRSVGLGLAFATVFTTSSVSALGPLDVWQKVESGVSNTLTGTTFANGEWVAVGRDERMTEDGTFVPSGGACILQSESGVFWQTAAVLPTGVTPLLPVHGPGGWMVFSAEGRCWMSDTGLGWIEHPADFPGLLGLHKVVYADGRWVAMGVRNWSSPRFINSACLWSSTNGTSWSIQLDLPFSVDPSNPGFRPYRAFKDVAWGGGRWIATHMWADTFSRGGSGMHSSTNAFDWQTMTGWPESEVLSLGSVAFSGGSWRVLAEGRIASIALLSRDGVEWDTIRRPSFSPTGPMAYGGGTWAVLSNDPMKPFGTSPFTASDGEWTTHQVLPDSSWGGIQNFAFGKGVWILVGLKGLILRSAHIVPPLLSAKFGDDGLFRADWNGSTGQRFRVEVSEDLAQWSPLNASLLEAQGQESFTDSDSGRTAQRFYRLVAPP